MNLTGLRAGFRPRSCHAALGVGDDFALLAWRPGMQLAISSSTGQGRHFFAGMTPRPWGRKAPGPSTRQTWRRAGPGRWPSRWHWRCPESTNPAGWLSKGLLALADAHGCVN